jgi:hypothetical protein
MWKQQQNPACNKEDNRGGGYPNLIVSIGRAGAMTCRAHDEYKFSQLQVMQIGVYNMSITKIQHIHFHIPCNTLSGSSDSVL